MPPKTVTTSAEEAPAPGASSGHPHLTPRWRTLMWRGATRSCPACGRRKLFGWKLVLPTNCPRCGLKFERIEGQSVGAVGMNTIVTFFLLMVVMVVGMVATFPDFPVTPLVVLSVAVALVHPILFHPTSQTLWSAVDMLMRKLDPDEVDWRFVHRKPTHSQRRNLQKTETTS